MFNQIRYWHWIAVFLFLDLLTDFNSITQSGDLSALILVTLSLIILWREPSLRNMQSPAFSIGVSIYWLAVFLDYIDGMLNDSWQYFADILDGLCFTLGFYLIAAAFIRLLRNRNNLIEQLQSEVGRSTLLQQELHRQANTDELTGLGNRRALFSALQHKLNTGETGHLLYIDVNNFKAVNDRFGHDAGDLLLKQCALKLQRDDAEAFRLGGDEFVVLLTKQEPKSWMLNLERLACVLTQEYDVSLSIGLAAFSPEKATNPDELLDLADKNMYSEKQSSRHRRQSPR